MEKEITIKIDEDNDIYEMRVRKLVHYWRGDTHVLEDLVYTVDNVYDSEYGDLWDELNMSIEITN
jgi:hypothetical protein